MDYKMDYQTFQQELKTLAEEGLREKGDYSLSWYTSNKNNVSKRGLMISEKGNRTAITVYLDQFYQDYLQGETLCGISSRLINLAQEKKLPDISVPELGDYEKMKEKLRVRLVGRERNGAYLGEGPYKMHPIGAEVVYAELAKTEEGTFGMRVTHQVLEQWGVPEQEIFEAALDNSQKEESIRFGSVLSECSRIMGMESPEEEPVDKNGLYVLSNQSRDNGAAVLLYPGVLEEVHEKMGGDYYILPSSVHEVVILSKEAGIPPKELRSIVREINREQVLPEERLGDEVYEFLGETGTLQKCKIAEKEMSR